VVRCFKGPGKFTGYIALQGASLGEEIELVEILLAEGADINAPGSLYRGGTAIHAAASKGNLEIVKSCYLVVLIPMVWPAAENKPLCRVYT
jgi:Ankyrin repeats (3 copies)